MEACSSCSGLKAKNCRVKALVCRQPRATMCHPLTLQPCLPLLTLMTWPFCPIAAKAALTLGTDELPVAGRARRSVRLALAACKERCRRYLKSSVAAALEKSCRLFWGSQSEEENHGSASIRDTADLSGRARCSSTSHPLGRRALCRSIPARRSPQKAEIEAAMGFRPSPC